MDANEEVWSARMKSFILALRLINPILTQHSNPPATCDKNSQRQSIDAIWTIWGLCPLQSGYLPFGTVCRSDHCVLWVPLPKHYFLGNSPKLALPKQRRLKASDPQLVDRYIALLLPKLQQHNLIRRLPTLQLIAHNDGWNQTLENEYNAINQLQIQLSKEVETKVRKLCAGGIPWSPVLQNHRDTILALQLLTKKQNCRQVSNRLIQRTLAKRISRMHTTTATPNYNNSCPLHSLITNPTAHESLREDFLPSLAQARADKQGTSFNCELRQLQRIESQWKSAQTIKMRKKLDCPPIT